ncbi:pogo transposable element derived with ZNF domain b isoform X2 [Hippoglossus hippoglossus]|uniref:pogo transposable element derived with ZNF domain b isoform X2 n=1 Tax=Hippoglossus hippoglossus TaxID=8267 RepID=UPI00148D5CFD|nr:pogo transposable element derived with ZNF domain b isoform X2 [Hippoglossus hippoglossus]
METELFMECEEEELEPWQQVDDSVEEDEMDYMDNYGQPVEDSPPLQASETPPPRPPSITSSASPLRLVSSVMLPPPPPVVTSSLPPVPCLPTSSNPAVSAPPLVTQGPPLILTQTAAGTFLLPAHPRTGSAQPILLTTQTNVERFRFEDDRGRTFESRGEMVMCGGCGGKYFRIVSHLKKSRTCSSHLDLDTFEKQLILYNRKRKRKSDTKGFPVQTVVNPGTPLLLNLQPGQTVQPLTLIQSSSLGQLVRPRVGVSLVHPQGQTVQTRTSPAPSGGPTQPGSTFTAMQLPATLTFHTSTPGPINFQMTQLVGANSLKLAGSPALPSSSANGVTRLTVISSTTSGPIINTASRPTPIFVTTPSMTSAPSADPHRVVMSVEEFYYGTFEGDLSLRRPQPLGIQTSTFTCQICTHLADNNLRLMQHMLQHSELIGVSAGDERKCCRFCYRQFSSPAQLQTHQDQVHGSVPSPSMCRICEWAFENEPAFLNHMKSNHKPGEMPYICQVCSYRSSFYSDVLQHFASFHRDSRFLLCVFCLKVTRNPINYQQHLLRHQINQAFHCNRCRLQFVLLKDKMQHKLENHRSFRRPAQLEGLPPGSKVTIRTYVKFRPPISSAGGRLLQTPSSLAQPIHIKTEPQRSATQRNTALSRSLRSPIKRPVNRRVNRDRLVCLECGTDASDLSAHYPTHVHCLLCPYSSCCSRAYAAHMIHHHVPRSKDKVVLLHRLPPPCPFLLQCSQCELRPQNADQMADHLLKNPEHHSATCRIRTYVEPDIQFCYDGEQCSSEEQEPDQNKDLPDPSWRAAAFWKQPAESDITKSTIAAFMESSGPHHNLTKNSDAIDFFNLLFPAALVELITNETNAHVKTCQFLGSFYPKWVPVTTHEIKGFIGLVVLMGIQNLPDPSHYWSWSHYDNSYTFYRAMSFKRFRQIAANIRMGSFAIDEYRGTNNPSDSLHIFRPMLDLLGGAMWNTYRPNCSLTIDRALLPSLEEESCQVKGNPKTQPQVWLLCDSKSGYCHRFFIQVGEKAGKEPGFTVVPGLVKGLEDKRHQLYLANSLTSVPLMQKLLNQGIYASSSFPPPSPILPRELWEEGQVEKPGDFLQRQCGSLLATRWRDTKEMGCLSTNASPGEPDTVWRRSQTKVGGLDPINRPKAFRLLQENMRGVDICKQLLACNPLGGIPQDRHWRGLFWFLINLCIVNAFIVLRESRKENPPAWVQDGLFTQVNFRKRLGNQLAKCAQKYFETMEIASSRGMRMEVAEEVVKQRHRMVKISAISKRCKNCNLKNIRHESVYGCVICKANLCKHPSCFWEYHGLSPLNKGSTKVGFLKDRISGAVEVDEVKDNMDAAMAPVEDIDFSDDERVDDFDDMDEETEDVKQELIKEVKHPVSDLQSTMNCHAQLASNLSPLKERDDILTARQLRIALFALCDGLRQASRVFSTETKLIQTWLKEAKKRLRQREQEQNVHGDGGSRLVAWVLSMREQQLPITESNLFHKVSTLKKKGGFSDSFRISYDWAVSFMLHHQLGIQNTGTASKLARTLPSSLEAKVMSFRKFTHKIIRVHKLSESTVAAMDELCLFVDLRLVQDKSRRSEALELIGSLPLVTVFLAALADGTMLPSLVLANRQLDEKVLPEFILLEAGPESLLVEEALDLWTNKIWHQHVCSRTQPSRSILVLDRHREHMGDQFLTSISGSGTLPAMIPGGCSFSLQPLDICVKPVLQRFMLLRWAKFIAGNPKELEETSPQQLQANVAQLLVDWMVEALMHLNKLSQLWENSFRLTGLLPKEEEGLETMTSQKPEEVQLDLFKTLTETILGPESRETTSSGLLELEDEEDTKEEPEGVGLETSEEKQERIEEIEREVKDRRENKETEMKEHGQQDDTRKHKTIEEDSEEDGKETEEDRKEVNKERRETRIVIGEEVGDEWKIKSRTEGVEADGDADDTIDKR